MIIPLPLYDFHAKRVIWREVSSISQAISHQQAFSDFHKIAFLYWCASFSTREEFMPANKSQKFLDFEFVNYKLTKDDKKQFDKWASDNADKLIPLVTQLFEAGYKLSISPDLDNLCYIATITSTKHSAHNKMSAMTSRSDDWTEAVMIGLYKHFVVFDGADWPKDADRDSWG